MSSKETPVKNKSTKFTSIIYENVRLNQHPINALSKCEDKYKTRTSND